MLRSKLQCIFLSSITGFKPTVISIDNEPVQIKHGNGRWMSAPGRVLFDTGNTLATAISEDSVNELKLKPDESKTREAESIGGIKCEFNTVPIEVNVRGHKFKVDALVGAVASETDLLIGADIINPLIKKKYTFGECVSGNWKKERKKEEE